MLADFRWRSTAPDLVPAFKKQFDEIMTQFSLHTNEWYFGERVMLGTGRGSSTGASTIGGGRVGGPADPPPS